jgi:hypothetical protein
MLLPPSGLKKVGENALSMYTTVSVEYVASIFRVGLG